MPSVQINFTRKECNIEKSLIRLEPVDNQVWTMHFKGIKTAWQDDAWNRFAQMKMKNILKDKFASVAFCGASSIYFYFTDGADEVEFMMWAESEEQIVEV